MTRRLLRPFPVFLLSVTSLSMSGCPAATPAQEPTAPVAEAPSPVASAPGASAAQSPSSEEATEEEKSESPGMHQAIEDAMNAKDRSAEDRSLDAGRKPSAMLSFFGIAPGMRVAELAAGGGYTMELLSRVVGSEGKVYAQNNQFVLNRFAEEPFSARLQKPLLANVVRMDREFDSPLVDEAKDLDAVLMVLFYHDAVWQKADRAAMNRSVFESLKPGGVFGIVDHSAKKGAGTSVAKTLHRIEESVLISEVSEAGFVLEASASFLRNPEDSLDWNAAPSQAGAQRGTSDRFVLRFRKPEPLQPALESESAEK